MRFRTTAGSQDRDVVGLMHTGCRINGSLLAEAASVPINGDYQAPFSSDPEVFDPRMAPTDYELHCALLLRSAGWDAQTTVASGDQGTDVIARRGGVVLVLQCKLYSQPVGNSAVQEISAARLHQRADYAAVVSNASFTPAARGAPVFVKALEGSKRSVPAS